MKPPELSSVIDHACKVIGKIRPSERAFATHVKNMGELFHQLYGGSESATAEVLSAAFKLNREGSIATWDESLVGAVYAKHKAANTELYRQVVA